MKRKKLSITTILLAVMILTAACGSNQDNVVTQSPSSVPAELSPTTAPTSEPEPELIQIIDDLGNEIILEEPAQKIISISPNLTEIVFSIGAGDRLIGRDSNSMYPEAALQAVDLGGMWDGIPVEEILAMEPDLILAGEIYGAEAIAELRDLGLVVYWQANPGDFEGLYSNILDISYLVGEEDEAAAIVESLSGRVDDLVGKLQNVELTPLVFYELDASEPANPWTTGAGTFISYVIEQAKGINLGDSLDGDWVQISSEALVAQNPDFILLADALYGITPESLAERPGWSQIKAVENGNVFPFDPFILSVPGPRLVDGFEQLAVILHPEIAE
jgi:iron complex transport system substrate-binding protein